MTANDTTSKAFNCRIGRYIAAAGAVAASAVPSQAAPITVILPSPVDIRLGYQLDMDQDGSPEFRFSGSGSTAFASYLNQADILASFDILASSTIVQQLSAGASFSNSGLGWFTIADMKVDVTAPASFLAIRFGISRESVGFAQFNGPMLYGFAWEQASSITTFDLQSSSEVPEPATGALAALALGAVALAARKRKQV